MSPKQVDARLCAQTDDGYMVVSIERDRYFSVTVDVYRSQRAYEIGGEPHSCGQMHEDVLRAFPDLAPVVAMHLADVETGEPMHGPANGWYRLGGADMAHEIDYRVQHGRGNYYKAPEPIEGDDLSPTFAQFFVDMAARSLSVTVEMLPNVQDPDLFAAWVEDVARPYWLERASEANAMSDALVANEELLT